MGADEGAGKGGNRVGIGPETSVPLHDDIVVGIDAEIDHRTEIEIEAGLGQFLGHGLVEAFGGLWRGEARVGADAPRRRKVAVPGQALYQSPS